ncbi:MAG TPA: hypothetical protein VI407_09120 [Erythrobacter sp.]
MNFQFDAVMFLALFTLGAGLVVGVVSWLRARNAQAHHEDAAVAERQRHEDVATPVEGTPGNIDPTVSDHSGDTPALTESDRSWSRERDRNPPTPMPPRN